MKRKNTKKITSGAKMRNTLMSLGMVGVLGAGVTYGVVSTKAATAAKLQNGGFEKLNWNESGSNQIDQSKVENWNTTAFDGRIEIVRPNTNSYISNVTLKPTEGKYAVELNADEESTLYQNVTTTPSSIYEWGLDHGGRNTMDTMALIIGPKQDVDPAKPSKNGRDQMMQMVDWLIAQGKAEVKSTSGIDQQITVYSKKFGAKGTFEDNAGNNAFSLTPSSIYTEEWHVWIMADGKASSGTNPWGSYGSNAEGSAGSSDGSGGTDVDLSKYYLYTVPAGQTETLFGFVSVGVKGTSNKTLGNFLDNINFQLYHPLSGSTTTHGSAIVGGSDGSSEAEGASKGHEVRVDGNLATYVTDGTPLKIQAIVKKADEESCDFVGVYYTGQDDKGKPKTEFLKKADNVIDYSKDLTEEQKKGKWLKSTNSDGDIVYTYYLNDVTAAVDLHFVFIKSPTITYDANGGKPYVVDRTYNTGEAENVYSFKPVDGTGDSNLTFIAPYTSKAAEGQNDGWKFMGWLLTGDQNNSSSSEDTVNVDKLGELLLPAEHTVACNYSVDGATGEEASQYFNILNGKVSLTEKVEKGSDDSTVSGAKWEGYTSDQRLYASLQKGLTMVAQWRWRQAFIPQTQLKGANSYEESSTGGTVEITSVTDKNDSNYTAEYGEKGAKAYHAQTNETITAKAEAKDGFVFEGWYDANGKLLTTKTTYSYTETKESVNTFYARFSGGIKQTYIRQLEKDGKWEDIQDDNIAVLGRYEYIDAAGMPVSSTAEAKNGYKFVGWYDANGDKVSSDNLTNDGKTLSYKTKEDATYYARFEKTYNVKFVAQTKQKDGSFANSETGGKVSTKSVTDIAGATASSNASANSGYKFLGWYDKDGNALGTNAGYSASVTKADGVTYYARFEITYNVTVEDKTYLSFIAESENTGIPDVFSGRDAGTGKNTDKYGLDSKYGNTISTGFKYSLDNVTDVSTIQITVKVPDTAYVKTGGTSKFTGTGAAILSDSGNVSYNKGSIYKISGATTLTYYWDVSDLKAGTEYGVIIDNLYAPGATATITVNGTDGTKITDENGVVNTSSADYESKSHYSK